MSAALSRTTMRLGALAGVIALATACSSNSSKRDLGEPPAKAPSVTVEKSAGSPSTETDFVKDACALVPLDVVEHALGSEADVKSTNVACVYVAKGDVSKTIELLKEPAAVLSTQLNEGDFSPYPGVGDKAYWDADQQLLVAVSGSDDFAVSAFVADSPDANRDAAVAIARAAIDA